MNFSIYQENNSAESERHSFGYSATQQADPAVLAAQLPMQGVMHPLQQQAPAQAPPYGYPSHQMQGSMYPMQNLYPQLQDPQSQQPTLLHPGLIQPPDGRDAYQLQQFVQAQALYLQPHLFSGVTPMYLQPQQSMSIPMVGSPQQFFTPQGFPIQQQMVPQSQVPEGMQPTQIGLFGAIVPTLVPAETLPTLESVQTPSNASSESGVSVHWLGPKKALPTLGSVQTPSNASSESGVSVHWLGPKKAPTVPSKQQLPARKRSPPGFDKMPLKDKRDPMKRSVPVTYAKAAKPNKRDPARQSEPAFKNPRNSRNSFRSERQVRPVRKQVLTKPAPQRNQPAPQRKSKKKFGFRSKQNMIDKTYNAISQKYSDMGILAGMDEVLRGETTIRLHVKKFRALQRIQEALLAVENNRWIIIDKISIPMSMKNQFQKKGFLVYCRVAELSMVDEAKRVFQSFDEFKKCEVAHQTNPMARLKSTILASTENASRFRSAPAVSENIDFEDIEAAEAANKAWHANAAKKAGHVEKDAVQIVADSDWDDAFCGSVESCSLDQVEEVAPELNEPAEANPLPEENNAEEIDFAFADKMMMGGGDCGLVDLGLGPIDMCPQLSHGEAGL